MNNIAIFKGLSKSKKSAKVFIKTNELELHGTFGYLAAAPFEGKKVGDTMSVPSGWRIEHRADENGEQMSFDNGDAMNFFTWAPAAQ